jgi:hypothetical protein
MNVQKVIAIVAGAAIGLGISFLLRCTTGGAVG